MGLEDLVLRDDNEREGGNNMWHSNSEKTS